MMTLFATVTLLQLFDLESSDGDFFAGGSSGQWEYGAFTSGPPGAENRCVMMLFVPFCSASGPVGPSIE